MPGPLGKKSSSIGKLRHQVKIQAVNESTRNEFGAIEPTWADVGQPVWCKVEATGGEEAMRSDMVQAHVSHRVEMRFRTGLTPKHRLVWLNNGNAILNITAISPSVGFGNMLEILCLMEA